MTQDAKIDFRSVRLSTADSVALETIRVALINPTLRPRVSLSDAVRAAIQIAAGALTAPGVGAAGVA